MEGESDLGIVCCVCQELRCKCVCALTYLRSYIVGGRKL